MKDNGRKNFIWNISGVTCNCLTSLLPLILVTRINGVDASGIFSFSFTNACILYVVGIFMGRTFQVSETRKSLKDSDYFYTRILTCASMLVLAVIMNQVMGYEAQKSMVFITLVVYKGIEAFSDVLHGILQKQDKLYQGGISLTIKSLGSIVIFAITDIVTKNLVLSCMSMVIFSMLITIIYDFPRVRHTEKTWDKLQLENVWELLKKGSPVFLTVFLSMLSLNAPKYAIDQYLLSSDQAIYGIIIMPATVIALGGQFLVQPFLMKMTTSFYNQAYEQFRKIVVNMVVVIVAFGVFTMTVSYLIGIPILELVYSIDLSGLEMELAMIIMGATMRGVTLIMTSALVVMRRNIEQMMIGIITTILAIIISYPMVSAYGMQGAVWAYVIVMILEMMFFVIIFIRNYHKAKISKNGESDSYGK